MTHSKGSRAKFVENDAIYIFIVLTRSAIKILKIKQSSKYGRDLMRRKRVCYVAYKTFEKTKSHFSKLLRRS